MVSGQNESNTMELGLTAWWLKDRAGRYPAQLPKSHLPSLEAVWKTYLNQIKSNQIKSNLYFPFHRSVNKDSIYMAHIQYKFNLKSK